MFIVNDINREKILQFHISIPEYYKNFLPYIIDISERSPFLLLYVSD